MVKINAAVITKPLLVEAVGVEPKTPAPQTPTVQIAGFTSTMNY